MEKIEALDKAGRYLLLGEQEAAKTLINKQYPFRHMEATRRAYTDKQKMQQFKKDGFIDRYSGQKLVNPGFLKVLSHYMPKEFPYHSHWKMEECHNPELFTVVQSCIKSTVTTFATTLDASSCQKTA